MEVDDKGFFEFSRDVRGELSNITAYAGGYGGQTLGELQQISSMLHPGIANQVNTWVAAGYGGYTTAQLMEKMDSDAVFAEEANKNIERVGGESFGRVLTPKDLIRDTLAADPNFDINDEETLNEVTQDAIDRGFFNDAGDVSKVDREKLSQYATGKSVGTQIEKATSPEKFLTEDELSANRRQAATLLSTIYGPDYQDQEGLTDFVATRLAEGESPYELTQFLKTTPDYQSNQADIASRKAQEEATAARAALDEELLRSQREAFNRATPEIISSYMRAGRLNSSGLNAALAKAQQDLESERQGYLSNIAFQQAAQQAGYNREDFVRGQASAYDQYMRQNAPAYQQKFALQGYGNQVNYEQPWANLARQYSVSDQERQRQYALEDYAMQQSDFNRYLADYRSQGKNNALYDLYGKLIGAGVTAGVSKWLGD